LGVTAVETPEGVRVAQIEPGSGAAQAGLRPGDVITHVEGRRVTTIQQLSERLLDFEPGDAVSVTVLRDGEREVLRVRLSGSAERVTQPGRAPSAIDGFDGQLERLFRDAEQLPPGQRRQLLERVTELMRAVAAGGASNAPPRADLPRDLAPAPQPATALLPEGDALERLADLVAERLTARADHDVAPAPAPEASALVDAPPGELTVYFGRVTQLGDASIVLTGGLGPIRLQYGEQTQTIGNLQPRVGGLVVAVTRGREMQLLIVIG
jgi:membrane-associated protease RseP (regulator of RpoE activity)